MKGTVTRFFAPYGYGFILGEDGNEYFVHQTAIKMDGFRKLKRNWIVEFNSISDDDRGKRALSVRILSKDSALAADPDKA